MLSFIYDFFHHFFLSLCFSIVPIFRSFSYFFFSLVCFQHHYWTCATQSKKNPLDYSQQVPILNCSIWFLVRLFSDIFLFDSIPLFLILTLVLSSLHIIFTNEHKKKLEHYFFAHSNCRKQNKKTFKGIRCEWL